MSTSTVLYGVLATGALLFIVLRRRRASPLPPGPTGYPFIGNLLQLPSTEAPLIFHQWAKVYGDVMHLQVLGRRLIILDTYDAAVDLLEKRGLIYSDRPKFVLYELLGWDPSLAFSQYSKMHKQRQMHQSYLSRQRAQDFRIMQTQEARMLIRNLFQCKPNKYEKYLSRLSTGIITQIVAGHRITSNDDPYLYASDMVIHAMAKTGPPGNSPLDFFPWLRHFPAWFPGAAHVGIAKAWRATVRELHDFPLRTVKQLQERGEANPSFLLEQLELLQDGEDEDELKGAAATMFGAGESTTWSTISSFIIAMVLHPECQLKAQEELDRVVGPDRLPGFADRENLPYIDCLLQETLRWNPAVPLGIPHRLIKDDTYRGMLLLEGSLVFANIRGIGLDPKVYTDPNTFNPSRFLSPLNEPPFLNVAFGFGRRICTGRYVAENTLWIAIASLLACCEISKAREEDGRVVVPDSRLTDGLVSHPRDMRCVIKPRSAETEKLVMELGL